MKPTFAATSTLAAAILAISLAGCAPASAPIDSSSDEGDTVDSSEESTDDGASGDFVTLSGTGTYAVPEDAPIGSYELPDNQDALPAGCTYEFFDKSGTSFGPPSGPFIFLTDATATFTTEGCPDWVQYQ